MLITLAFCLTKSFSFKHEFIYFFFLFFYYFLFDYNRLQNMMRFIFCFCFFLNVVNPAAAPTIPKAANLSLAAQSSQVNVLYSFVALKSLTTSFYHLQNKKVNKTKSQTHYLFFPHTIYARQKKEKIIFF